MSSGTNPTLYPWPQSAPRPAKNRPGPRDCPFATSARKFAPSVFSVSRCCPTQVNCRVAYVARSTKAGVTSATSTTATTDHATAQRHLGALGTRTRETSRNRKPPNQAAPTPASTIPARWTPNTYRRRNRSPFPGRYRSAQPIVGRPKNSSRLTRPAPRMARARSSFRNRTTHTSNPIPAKTVTTGNRLLSKMAPLTSHPSTLGAPNESYAAFPLENASCVVHRSSTRSGTSIQDAASNDPTPTMAARPIRRRIWDGLISTHAPITSSARYPVRRWAPMVSAVIRAAGQYEPRPDTARQVSAQENGINHIPHSCVYSP